jgi:penicillin amidase
MIKILRRAGIGLLVLLLLAGGAAAWWVHGKQPQRSGDLELTGLQAPVQVRYDEAGVPHIEAQHEADLYRALGYLHAQDRLFQMELLRRLARGELAEILGPKLVPTDRLFRTLAIRHHADAHADRLLRDQADSPAVRALLAYLDGINHYQASRPAPLEFDILGITRRPFTAADTLSVAGYLAYSFAAAFRTEPLLSQVRERLGPGYLAIFDLELTGDSALAGRPGAQASVPGDAVVATTVQPATWHLLQRLARLGSEASAVLGVPSFEGSNAWVLSGSRTASGKPLLAGDPHIAFAAPAVWWEAHLKAPGFELYGHFAALNPMALLGHNQRFGWSLTMFQNDDVDLVLERVNPDQPNQVWHEGSWVEMTQRRETIRVKGGDAVELDLRRSPHGPIVNDALGPSAGSQPIAMWWALLETENPTLQAFYQLNRADTLDRARAGASLIHAPGLNVLWANADGDIGWWAAARLPIRPDGVHPGFVLDAGAGQARKLGFLPFSANPQEENPARGYIVSANHRPRAMPAVPGHYNLWDRALRLDTLLQDPQRRWDTPATQALQRDVQTGYGPRVLEPLLADLAAAVTEPGEQALLARLRGWTGDYALEGVAPVLFQQFLFELARHAMEDDLGAEGFELMRRTRAVDHALPRLAAQADSPWWDRRGTPAVETRAQAVAAAWRNTLQHLRATLGEDPAGWTWGRAHTVTHNHALGRQKPLDRLFDVGPLPAPGAHEVPNNLSARLGPAPWAVVVGPSTRRIVDFAQPGAAQGINPVGQSGVWGDAHYRDQADAHAQGRYRPQHLDEADVARHTRSTLRLLPR